MMNAIMRDWLHKMISTNFDFEKYPQNNKKCG